MGQKILDLNLSCDPMTEQVSELGLNVPPTNRSNRMLA